jgi:hypothetical protein
VARGRVVGIERVDVAGTEIETVHIRIATTLSGESRGGGSRDYWLARATGLPVRQLVTNRNVTPSALGEVTYRERYELSLVSVDPRR